MVLDRNIFSQKFLHASPTERTLLIEIAKQDSDVISPGSFNKFKGASRLFARLEADEILIRTERGKYRVFHPLFKSYLRKQHIQYMILLILETLSYTAYAMHLSIRNATSSQTALNLMKAGGGAFLTLRLDYDILEFRHTALQMMLHVVYCLLQFIRREAVGEVNPDEHHQALWSNIHCLDVPHKID